jgi:hypothetical protein
MEFDRKTIQDQCETDRLQAKADELKHLRKLRAKFNAADDKADFIAMAGGDLDRAFKSFCHAAEKHA